MQLPCFSLCSALLLYTLTKVASSASSGANYPNSITLSYESVHDTSSVKPLATIFYDPKSLKSTLSSWTPPSAEIQSTTSEPTTPQLLRILLPNGSSTLTSLATFNNSLTQTVSLHISPNDATIFSASVAASVPIPPARTSKSKSKSKSKKATTKKTKAETQQPAAVLEDFANVHVELIAPKAGPVPKLNSRKPPVVGADGKEVPAEEVPEKSFFQKYWWAFILISILAMAGSGEK